MKEYPKDSFHEIAAIIARIFADMNGDFESDMPRVYGYRVIIRDGDIPSARSGSAEILSKDTAELVPEVHRIGDDVIVVIELPGASTENLTLAINGQTLSIEAEGADRRYCTTASLPPVDPASMQKSFKNGVLEVTFRAQLNEEGKPIG